MLTKSFWACGLSDGQRMCCGVSWNHVWLQCGEGRLLKGASILTPLYEKSYPLCILIRLFYSLTFSVEMLTSFYLLINVYLNDFPILLMNQHCTLKRFCIGVIVTDNCTIITSNFVLFNSL